MTPARLLVATTNANKIREIRRVLEGAGVEMLTLRDVAPVAEPEETGDTFWQNARIKAFAYAVTTDLPVVAEDSGIEIAALGGEPGVRSARFLGADVTYQDRFAEIYRRFQRAGNAARDARFVTALAVVRGSEVVFETEAAIEGQIADQPAGEYGFGYDPIFYYAPMAKTTAQLTLEEKSAVSHRARAFRDFIRWLRGQRRP